jgi:hypothetical protein
MYPLRVFFSFGAFLNLSALLLGLNACSSGSSGPPGYTLTAAALNPGSVTSGTSSTSTIGVTSANGYSGSVRFSCSIAAAGMPAPSCLFSTPTVTISGSNSGTSTLTVSTSSSTPGGNYTISVSGVDANKLPPSNGPQTLTLTLAAVIEHVVIIFQENRTPDNLFQDPVLISRGADIAASGLNSLGQTVPLSPIDLGTVGSDPQNYDLGHSHSDFVAMYDGGKMDVRTSSDAIRQMQGTGNCALRTRIPIHNSNTSNPPTCNPTSLWPSNTLSATACFKPTKVQAFPLISSSFRVLRPPLRLALFSHPKIPSSPLDASLP